MKTLYGYTCDRCERETPSIWLGDHNEDLCPDCYQSETSQPVFQRARPAVKEQEESPSVPLFVPHDDPSGTSRQGYLDISYQELVAILGPPHTNGDGYKVDAEWGLKFPDGTVATIYNYKDGKNYCGPEGLPTEAIRDWHIGGHTKAAEQAVVNLIHRFKQAR
jgi:hypothetical protein